MSGRDDAIRDELGRVLASDAFVASPMLSAFLRFVVEETLAGREDRLKAYTIAVGALDRPESFDPNDSPVVRVQARRLRQALRRHYETAGADSPIRIDLPLGNYVPVFVDCASPEPSEAAPAEPSPASVVDAAPPRRRPPLGRRVYGLGRLAVSVTLAALIGVALGFGGWQLWHRLQEAATPVETRDAARPTAEERHGLDASRVLPLLRIDVETRASMTALDADIYRNRLESFARHFDDTIVLTRRSPDYPAPDGQPLYVLGVLLSRDGSATNAYYRLSHAGDERILASGALRLGTVDVLLAAPDDPLATPPDLALLRDFVQLHGAISHDLANLPDLAPELTCFTKAWTFELEASADALADARHCLEPIVADNPRLAPAATLLGAAYLGEYRLGLAPKPTEALEQAERMLRRAILISPTSSGPYQVLQNLLLIEGDAAAAVEAGARAVMLNPEDMNAVGGDGAALVSLGRYEEALARLRRAEANLASPPKWLQFYTFLALNNLGRPVEADRRVAYFEGTRSALYLTAVAIRAHRRGDDASATAALAEIAEMEPSFTTAPRAFFRHRGFSPAVIDRLMVDLEAAGLRVPTQ